MYKRYWLFMIAFVFLNAPVYGKAYRLFQEGSPGVFADDYREKIEEIKHELKTKGRSASVILVFSNGEKKTHRQLFG